jgi:FKBP-type peptidyl-prolyl cis-trans isomerase FkpA
VSRPRAVARYDRSMIRRFFLAAVLLGAVACNGTSGSTLAPTSAGTFTISDLVAGTGTQAVAGNRVTVSYTGWLYDTSQTNGKGKQFDTSSSFSFTIGAGQVIKGWDQGVAGMRVGGQRRLIIPPDLAYGNQAVGSTIPANATLVFDITLISIG